MTQLPEPQVATLQGEYPSGLRHEPAFPGYAQVHPVVQLAAAQHTESTQCPDAHSAPFEHAVPSGAVPARATVLVVSRARVTQARATQRAQPLIRRVEPIAFMVVTASPCRPGRPERPPVGHSYI